MEASRPPGDLSVAQLPQPSGDAGTVDSLFRKADTKSRGFLDLSEVHTVLFNTFLSKQVINQIWGIVAGEERATINAEEFADVLRLAACAQAGIPLDDDALRKRTDLVIPFFDHRQSPSSDPLPLASEQKLPSCPRGGSVRLPSLCDADEAQIAQRMDLGVEEVRQYLQHFRSIDSDRDGFITADEFEDHFSFMFTSALISTAWASADQDGDGRASKEEFILAAEMLRALELSCATEDSEQDDDVSDPPSTMSYAPSVRPAARSSQSSESLVSLSSVGSSSSGVRLSMSSISIVSEAPSQDATANPQAPACPPTSTPQPSLQSPDSADSLDLLLSSMHRRSESKSAAPLVYPLPLPSVKPAADPSASVPPPTTAAPDTANPSRQSPLDLLVHEDFLGSTSSTSAQGNDPSSMMSSVSTATSAATPLPTLSSATATVPSGLLPSTLTIPGTGTAVPASAPPGPSLQQTPTSALPLPSVPNAVPHRSNRKPSLLVGTAADGFRVIVVDENICVDARRSDGKWELAELKDRSLIDMVLVKFSSSEEWIFLSEAARFDNSGKFSQGGRLGNFEVGCTVFVRPTQLGHDKNAIGCVTEIDQYQLKVQFKLMDKVIEHWFHPDSGEVRFVAAAISPRASPSPQSAPGPRVTSLPVPTPYISAAGSGQRRVNRTYSSLLSSYRTAHNFGAATTTGGSAAAGIVNASMISGAPSNNPAPAVGTIPAPTPAPAPAPAPAPVLPAPPSVPFLPATTAHSALRPSTRRPPPRRRSGASLSPTHGFHAPMAPTHYSGSVCPSLSAIPPVGHNVPWSGPAANQSPWVGPPAIQRNLAGARPIARPPNAPSLPISIPVPVPVAPGPPPAPLGYQFAPAPAFQMPQPLPPAFGSIQPPIPLPSVPGQVPVSNPAPQSYGQWGSGGGGGNSDDDALSDDAEPVDAADRPFVVPSQIPLNYAWECVISGCNIRYSRNFSEEIETRVQMAHFPLVLTINKKKYRIEQTETGALIQRNLTTSYSRTLRKVNFDDCKADATSPLWSPMAGDQECVVVGLDSDSDEFKAIASEFYASIGVAEYKITHIERIQNRTQWNMYSSFRDTMARKHSSSSVTVERRLFHGCAADSVTNINVTGFNRSYRGKNGTNFGDGVYFAVSASYSSADKFSVPDLLGVKRMYLSRVLTGLFVSTNSSSKDLDYRYDSGVDNSANPTMFIIFRDFQAYPEYLISFASSR